MLYVRGRPTSRHFNVFLQSPPSSTVSPHQSPVSSPSQSSSGNSSSSSNSSNSSCGSRSSSSRCISNSISKKETKNSNSVGSGDSSCQNSLQPTHSNMSSVVWSPSLGLPPRPHPLLPHPTKSPRPYPPLSHSTNSSHPLSPFSSPTPTHMSPVV